MSHQCTHEIGADIKAKGEEGWWWCVLVQELIYAHLFDAVVVMPAASSKSMMK